MCQSIHKTIHIVPKSHGNKFQYFSFKRKFKLEVRFVCLFKAANLYKPTRPSDLNDKINFLSSHRFVVRIHSLISKIFYMSDIQRILTKHVIDVFIWIESNTCFVYNIHVDKRITNNFEQLTSSLNNHIQHIHKEWIWFKFPNERNCITLLKQYSSYGGIDSSFIFIY